MSKSAASTFHVENMDCPTEERLIRDKLSKMPGVDSLDFNLMQRRLVVNHRLESDSPVLSALHAIGMKAVAESPQVNLPAASDSAVVSRKQWWKIGLAGASALCAEIVAWVTGNESSSLVIALALAAVTAGGIETYKKGWIALRNRNLNINALMSIAVTGAMLIGQWPEAAMVMFLFALAEMIEALSLDRARNAIRGLMDMTPETATVLQSDRTWAKVESKRVAPGAVVRVGPGERIPLDGELVAGQSSVNQAPITGESIPVAKTAGDTVFAGSINETGSFEFRVTKPAGESTLARIIRAVEEAQGSRAPTQRFVDRFARIYTPLVFAMAVVVAVGLPLAFELPWMDSIYKALVLLVIACPCALVISTPVTVVSGLAAAARRGILIKGGAYLEQGRTLKALALDKTGTITRGEPAVTDVTELVGDADALRFAATIAARSDHPVSSAVSRHWSSQPDAADLSEVTEFAAITGRGVKGRIQGRWFYLGNHRLVEELGVCNSATEEVLERLEADGKTAVVLSDGSQPLAVIGVADTVRETSRQAIDELHKLGVRSLMLTGDNPRTAAAIAAEVGIDDARGDLLPEDKLRVIDEVLVKYQSVGMVGDGINDAPALARSSIGFAMGAAGTDTAIETADVALMDDDLRKIPEFIRLSRRTGAILKQNITVALGIKAVFLLLAIAGMATLWMAVFADMGASLLVVFNGLRLLRNS
jgi:Cd2+/Zn2+-exporting ATPase